MTAGIPRPRTPAGRAGLSALLASPCRALIGLDFDGTIAPIVPDPPEARAHPDVVPVLRLLASRVAALAVITGRPAAEAVEYGGLAAVPGIIVLGHYGWQRWQDGVLGSADAPPAVDAARDAVPGLLAAYGAPEGVRIEDKGHSIAVHTRMAADPEGALARLRGPLTELAAELGLQAEQGRMVLELRPRGVDKGAALMGLVREATARSVLFCGDDLGDLPAFAAVRALREEGIPGCAVASASDEAPAVRAAADLAVAGPAGVVRLLGAIAAAISAGDSAAGDSAEGGQLLG